MLYGLRFLERGGGEGGGGGKGRLWRYDTVRYLHHTGTYDNSSYFQLGEVPVVPWWYRCWDTGNTYIASTSLALSGGAPYDGPSSSYSPFCR